MSEAEYLTILDWIARDTVAGKRGQTPVGAPPVFKRLGIDAQEQSRMVKLRKPRVAILGKAIRTETLSSQARVLSAAPTQLVFDLFSLIGDLFLKFGPGFP